MKSCITLALHGLVCFAINRIGQGPKWYENGRDFLASQVLKKS